MLKELLDIILPRECIVCGDRLDRYEKHLCLHCLADLPMTYTWTMPRNRMADKFNELIQRDLQAYEPYSFASALFFYSAEANYRKIPYSIKYHGNTSAGKMFGMMLGKKLAAAKHFSDVCTVIPVPLHWMRAWRRGYNQAEVIASEIAKAMNAELRTDLLYRRRRTKTQTKQDMENKMANVKGAFALKEKALAKTSGFRHILIVDDVFTTGATLKECHRTLRQYFPASVRISVATLGFVGD